MKFAIEAYQRHGVDEAPTRPGDVLREDIRHSLQLALSTAASVFIAAVYLDGLLAAVALGLVGAFAGGQAGLFDTGLVKGAIAGALADRGVLRRTGPVYRFRHRHIQAYLAMFYDGSVST